MKALLACLVLVGSVAHAQPMMVDPSKMSGIPRPDPQVPAGTITVRLIRGALTNRMVGIDVTLTGSDESKPVTTVKTDAEGRATFSGLTGGPFIASAKEGETELETQSIDLQPQMGTRVMLVFPATGSGAPDGVGHPDKTLPTGTIVVRAEDDAGQALPGLDVIVGHARAGEQQVVELHAKTDVAGEAKFEGLDHKPESGYLAEVMASGVRFAGKPFKLEENMGAKVVLTVRQVSSDTSTLTIAEGSHLLVEVTDDAVQFIEVWRLHNGGTKAFDAGPGGLHIPLPRDSVQAQAPDGNPNFTIAGHDAIYQGPIPPGDTQLRVVFVLAYHGAHASLHQPTPIPFTRVALVTQQLPGLTVSGHEVHGEARKMQGRNLEVYFGEGTTRGGELHLELDGLPHGNPVPRYAAAGLCMLLVLVFAIYAAGGGGDRRTQLERERQTAFDSLVDIDARIADGSSPALVKEREVIVARLADLYRGLDELGHG